MAYKIMIHSLQNNRSFMDGLNVKNVDDVVLKKVEDVCRSLEHNPDAVTEAIQRDHYTYHDYVKNQPLEARKLALMANLQNKKEENEKD